MKRNTRIPKRLPKPASQDPAIREYYRNLRRYTEKYISLMRIGLKVLIPDLKDEAAEEQPDIKIYRNDSDIKIYRSGAYSVSNNATRADSAHRVSRMDANIEKKVRDLLEDVQAELDKAFPNPMLEAWAKRHAVYVSNISKKNIKKVTEKVGLDVEPMMHDRGLSSWMQNVVEENVGLIRSMTKQKQETFKNGLVALLTSDSPHDQIRKMIQENFSFTRAKARMIARDQTGKINGRINQYRQQSLGGTRYVWRGSKDERERKDHRLLEGKIFSWDKPPIVDRRTGRRANPGEDYQCRCHAEMYLADILD